MLFVPLVHDGSSFLLSLLFVQCGLVRVKPFAVAMVGCGNDHVLGRKKYIDLVFGDKSLRRARFTVERKIRVLKSHHFLFLFCF